MSDRNTESGGRLKTLDAVRGFAVMGILILNIVEFGMPGYAYVDPWYYGGAEGANWAAWAVNWIVADGKLRGLFTMMFGASTVLIAERALKSRQSPARAHYARMASLFVLGMIHAYLIWSGDILVLYSLCGAVAFLAWRWPSRILLTMGAALLVLKLGMGLFDYGALHGLQAAAEAPGAPAATVRQWRDLQAHMTVPTDAIPAELAGYRGSYVDALKVRVPFTWFFQTNILTQSILDTIALMLIGMALFRLGFFSGEWRRSTYRWVAIVPPLICLPLYVPLLLWLDHTRVSPITQLATEAIHLTLLRPPLSLAYAAMVILFMQSGAARWLADRLAAAGRMAFSNYLGTSIVCTLIFNGYGLGWYGYLERAQLYGVVVLVWALILLWSKPWLDRFAYGPFEWVWRSMARMEFQPMRRRPSS